MVVSPPVASIPVFSTAESAVMLVTMLMLPKTGLPACAKVVKSFPPDQVVPPELVAFTLK